MTAQFYFHLATNVTIPPVSATFHVLSVVLNMLANWQINPKKMGLSWNMCMWLLGLSSNAVANYSPLKSPILSTLWRIWAPEGSSKRWYDTFFKFLWLHLVKCDGVVTENINRGLGKAMQTTHAEKICTAAGKLSGKEKRRGCLHWVGWRRNGLDGCSRVCLCV